MKYLLRTKQAKYHKHADEGPFQMKLNGRNCRMRIVGVVGE